MLKTCIRFLSSLILCVSFGESYAQSLDFTNIKSAKKLTVSGGLSFNNLYNSYTVGGAPNYSYFVNGTINFNILGLIDIPLNLNFSNRQFSYSQPYSFNQFSITPRYKWVTAYLGTTAMTFSPYTLNGHQFTGAGVDLMPGRWQVSAMAGRLIRSNTDSTYNRMGYGLKVKYNQGKFLAGINFLHAADNPASISNERLLSTSIRPRKNIVLGFEGGINFPKIAQLDVEISNSLIADNSGLSSVEQSGVNALFFQGNGAVRSLTAIKARMSRSLFNGLTTVGAGYERVDPGYTTFGGYFFTDDFENYTFNFAQRLWQNKINLSANIGTQRDLLETKANGQSRLVFSTNLVFTPSERFNANVNLSTFKSNTYIRNLIKELKRESTLIPIDTLNYTQINRNFATNISYTIRQKPEQTQTISLSGSIMDAANMQGNIIRQGQASQVFNGQLTYTFGLPLQKFTANIGYNYNLNTIGSSDVLVMGPTLNLQKSMLQDKLQTVLALNVLRSENKSAQPASFSTILNANLNASYQVSKKSQLSANILMLSTSDSGNEQVTTTPLPATIFTINFGYNYKF